MNRISKIIILLITILIALNYIMLLKFPVYPDEINWLVNISRYNLDHGKIFHYMKPCFDGFIEPPIYLKTQMAALSMYSNIHQGVYFRIIPLFFTMIISLSLPIGLYKSSNSPKVSITGFLILSIVILGTSGSIWNATLRQENILEFFLALTFLYVAFINKINFYWKNICFLLFIYLWTVISIAHPKGLYFVLVIFAIAIIQYKNLFLRIFLILSTGTSAYLISKFDYNLFINCKDLPEFNSWISSMNINPLTLLTNPREFIQVFFGTITSHFNNLLTRAPDNISYILNPSIGLLPPVPVTYKSSIINFIIKSYFIFNIIISIKLLMLAFSYVYKDIKNNRSLMIYSISIYLLFFIIILFNRTTNNYDIQFWNVSLTFINIIVLSILHKEINIFNNLWLLIFLFLYFSLSTHIFHHYYYKVFNRDWTIGAHAGPNAPLKYFSINAQNDMRTDFDDNCDPGSNSDLILFDDRTYIPLNNLSGRIAPFTYTALPYYYNNSLEVGKQNLSVFLAKYKSVVMYGSCSFSPELPSNFKLKYKFDKYSICCYKFIK